MVVRSLILFACLMMSAFGPSPALCAAEAAADIALERASVEDPGRPRIPIAIWSTHSDLAAPLIVISHGNGGYLDSHSDTARALAEAGFVVVALTHPGDNARDLSEVGKPEWFVDRPRHVSRVIDFMFSRWADRARLVPNKVGVFGFSAGGTTALILIGGDVDRARISTHCMKAPEFACTLFDQPAAPQGGPVFGQDMRDSRIAAAVIAAPGLGFAFTPESLAGVSVPVQLWSGDADRTVPYETNTAVVRRLLPDAPEFHGVPGAVHESFLAPCKAGHPSEICRDAPGFDRAAFHRTFNAAVVEFLRRHLAVDQRMTGG